MKQKKNLGINASDSSINTMVVENVSNETTTKSKKSVNPDNLEDTANSLEEESNPRKNEVFSRVKREIFGISEFDGNTDINREMAQKFANGSISFEDYSKFLSSYRKETNANNTEKENLTFEEVCKKINDYDVDDLNSDFCSFVALDLLSLKSLLIDGDKVVLYHGKQSENGDKFLADKVTVKGLHKPYSDVIYKSFADVTTSNILRAFQCYSYYKASVKRCKRQKKNETDTNICFINAAAKLSVQFGYSTEELSNILKSDSFAVACKELKKKK